MTSRPLSEILVDLSTVVKRVADRWDAPISLLLEQQMRDYALRIGTEAMIFRALDYIIRSVHVSGLAALPELQRVPVYMEAVQVLQRSGRYVPTEMKINIAEIDWQNANYIGNGEWSCVFDIGNDSVAKVGVYIKEDEEEAQQYVFSRYNKALPVLGSIEEIWLPPHIRKLYCPIHGLVTNESRQELLSDIIGNEMSWRGEQFTEPCTCEMALDVICMPKADPNISLYRDNREILEFIWAIDDICKEELHRYWDPAYKNVAYWKDHLVALDFTDRFYDWDSNPIDWTSENRSAEDDE